MAKIRVLHVSNRLELGGTEKTLQIFCQYLDKSRFEVFACGRMGGGVRVEALERYGIPVFIEYSGCLASHKSWMVTIPPDRPVVCILKLGP